jgi:hypothetical protein
MPTLRRPMQEGHHEFKASLGYTVGPVSKKQNNNNNKKKQGRRG